MSTIPVTPLAQLAPAGNVRALRAAKEAVAFEAQFLKSMLDQIYSGLEGEGPMGGAGIGADAWRSMLVDEHATAMAQRGGIGLAAAVYRDLTRGDRTPNSTASPLQP